MLNEGGGRHGVLSGVSSSCETVEQTLAEMFLFPGEQMSSPPPPPFLFHLPTTVVRLSRPLPLPHRHPPLHPIQKHNPNADLNNLPEFNPRTSPLNKAAVRGAVPPGVDWGTAETFCRE